MLRESCPKGIKVMMGLEILLLVLFVMGPVLALGGGVIWILTVLLGGGLAGDVGLGVAIIGAALIKMNAVAWLLSLAVSALALWQRARFHTPLSLATAILSLVHLCMAGYAAWNPLL